MTLTPGTRLGPYEIVELCGKGGMGEVYRARDTRLSREVAVKVLPTELSQDPKLKQRFAREATTISQLQHPNVCRLYDLGSEDGVDYLVMEFLEGETLENRLRRGRLEIDEMLRLGREIAVAIGAAHRVGVTHRDLKPGNVMLTETGAKVLDFGLARQGLGIVDGSKSQARTLSETLTSEGALVGTVPYMAPEQLEGKEADHRTDLWALGCILYEMATGERPFRGDTQASLIGSIMGSQPEPVSRRQPLTPDRVDWLVSRCLEKDPEKRWQSVREVEIELEALASGAEPGSAANGGARRQKRAWWAAAAMVALLGASLGWWLWMRTGSSEPEPAPGALDKARLAVLPFDNFSGDEALDQIALGIPEEVLSRFSGVWPVVARSTSFLFQGRDVCQAAQEMRVRHVLEGSVRRVQEQLTVTAQLIDCPKGEALWSKTYDRTGLDLLALQAEIARRIVAETLQVLWTSISTDDADSPLFYMSLGTKEGYARAVEMLREAAKRAPVDESFPQFTVIVLHLTLVEGWSDSPTALAAEMEELANRCLELNPQYWACHQAAGQAYTVTGQGEKMVGAYEQMVVRSRRLPVALGLLGDALALVGRSDEAIAHIEEAMLWSPEDRQLDQWHRSIAGAHFAAEDYLEARDSALRSVALNPRNWWNQEMLAASLGQLGDTDEARAAFGEVQKLKPERTLEVVSNSLHFSTMSPEHLARFVEGLRLAGMPE